MSETIIHIGHQKDPVGIRRGLRQGLDLFHGRGMGLTSCKDKSPVRASVSYLEKGLDQVLLSLSPTDCPEAEDVGILRCQGMGAG